MTMETLGNASTVLCFGGPYSNLQAAQAMRGVAERKGIGPEQVICTGDIVAYCSSPNETADLIRDWGCHVIKGNCEESLSVRADDCGCGFTDGSTCDLLSASWYTFANATLRDDLRDWMSRLPTSLTFEIGGKRARVVHGGVTDTSRFIFAGSPREEKCAELHAAGADIVIAGHCGIAFIESIAARTWFNAGAIGMPANDGTPDGWYGLINSGSEGGLTFSLHRLAYDYRTAARKLRDLGSRNPYADALESGRWPSLDVLPSREREATGIALTERSFQLG